MIFLGLLYDAHAEAALLKDSRTGLQAAPNQYQWGLIEGLSALGQEPLDVIASYPTGAYPRFSRKMVYGSRSFSWSSSTRIIYPKQLNIWVLRELVRAVLMYRAAKKCLKGQPHPKIIAYSLQLSFSLVIHWVKRRYPRTHVTVVVPDLPGTHGLQSSCWTPRRMWEWVTRPFLSRMLREADSFVLLSGHMRDVVKAGGRSSVVVEGFFPIPNADLPGVRASGRKIVAYTGTLEMAFGLGNLLDAFEILPDDTYELWLAGDGPARVEVEARAHLRENIRWFGFLDRQSVEAIQRESTVLVNPRQPEGPYTRYSFPSKTLVYLAAARPVIAYKLDGIPDDYDDYLFYVEGGSPEALATKIEEVCQLSDEVLDRIGRAGCDWARAHKSPIPQARLVSSLWSGGANG